METFSSPGDLASLAHETPASPRFFLAVWRLVRIDLYKLRRRRLLILLLIFGLLLLALFTALDILSAWSTATDSLSSSMQFGHLSEPELRASMSLSMRPLLFPMSLVLSTVSAWESLLIPLGMLGALLFGEDYHSGMIRVLLSRGSTRTQYILAKLVSLFLLSAIALLLAVGLEMLCKQLLAPVLIPRAEPPHVAFSWSWLGSMPLYLLSAVFGLFLYALIAGCLTLLTRSTAIGVISSLVLWIGWQVLNTIALAASVNPESGASFKFLSFLPIYLMLSLLAWQFPALVPRDFIGSNTLPDGTQMVFLNGDSSFFQSMTGNYSGLSSLSQALTLLLLYLVVLVGISWLVQARRDITN